MPAVLETLHAAGFWHPKVATRHQDTRLATDVVDIFARRIGVRVRCPKEDRWPWDGQWPDVTLRESTERNMGHSERWKILNKSDDVCEVLFYAILERGYNDLFRHWLCYKAAAIRDYERCHGPPVIRRVGEREGKLAIYDALYFKPKYIMSSYQWPLTRAQSEFCDISGEADPWIGSIEHWKETRREARRLGSQGE